MLYSMILLVVIGGLVLAVTRRSTRHHLPPLHQANGAPPVPLPQFSSERVEADRGRAWAAYDEAMQDYLDWIRLAGDFGCDVPFDPPTRPNCPRPVR